MMVAENKKAVPYGILVLHGFSGTLESVAALYDPLAALGVRVSMPLLSGHGLSSPEALRRVGWRDWLDDAERAFLELARIAERVIVVGHSMGSLLAIRLSIRFREELDSLVLATPPIRLYSVFAPGSPLAFLARPVSKYLKKWDLPEEDLFWSREGIPLHYPWVPTSAILSFFELLRDTRSLLAEVRHPFLLLQCRHETTVHPQSAEILCNSVSTRPEERFVVWFEHSEHQIFCDSERQQALQEITRFIAKRVKLHAHVSDALH